MIFGILLLSIEVLIVSYIMISEILIPDLSQLIISLL